MFTLMGPPTDRRCSASDAVRRLRRQPVPEGGPASDYEDRPPARAPSPDSCRPPLEKTASENTKSAISQMPAERPLQYTTFRICSVNSIGIASVLKEPNVSSSVLRSSFMRFLNVSSFETSQLCGRQVGFHLRSGLCLFGLLIGLSLPVSGQEQPFSRIDDEILHLTPVNRQLDYVRFQASLGAVKPMHPPTELFYFENVLLPAATWMDDDPDNITRRHLATASEIRRSVLPQPNPHGTISLLLTGNGETAMDSEEGQNGFRSNGPGLSDVSSPDVQIPLSGSWTAIPMALMLSRFLIRIRRRRDGDEA